MGNQFAGFRDYPTLPAPLADKLSRLLGAANRGHADVARFVADAIQVATAPHPVPTYRDVTAWRTAHATPPGGRFHQVITLQGNTFYATDPVPPVRHRHRAAGPLHAR